MWATSFWGSIDSLQPSRIHVQPFGEAIPPETNHSHRAIWVFLKNMRTAPGRWFPIRFPLTPSEEGSPF